MKKHLVIAAAGATLLVAGCGDQHEASAPLSVGRVTADTEAPAPSVVAATLSGLADSRLARTRIGYVNLEATQALRNAVDPVRVRRLVLGAGLETLSAASPAPKTAVQLGDDTTVLQGDSRTIEGGDATLREALEATTPVPNLLSDEAQSVVQSCLGDAAAEVIVGPTVMGRSSAVGVGLVDTPDLPKGPKLKLCAAPRFLVDIDRAERRFHRLFPEAGLAESDRPVIGNIEMGERELVGATIALDQVDTQYLGELLSGGRELVALAEAGPRLSGTAPSQIHHEH